MSISLSKRSFALPSADTSTCNLRLASSPIAVAELSAHLHLPIGAIRVLVGDLSVEGHVQTKAMTSAPNAALLERVRDGLRRL